MKAELSLYSPAYVKGRVRYQGHEKLIGALTNDNVVLALLHHGSWILIGGVVRHVLGYPYTVIASRRNFAVMPEDEVRFWVKAHRLVEKFYTESLFYSDEPPKRILHWLKQRPAVLGVAFDVREYKQSHREYPITFAGQQIWMQVNPARIARLSDALIVPASIRYAVEDQVHRLEFYDAIDPKNFASDAAVTQAVFTALESGYMADYQQGFNDLLERFRVQRSPSARACFREIDG